MISILHKTGLIKRKVNLQGDTTDFTWQYDAAGNRLSSNESLLPSQSTATTYSPNSLNQYSSVNSQAWSYDSDGNLLSDGTRTMTWDVKNRLAQVVIGGKTVSYVYDHNDWRVKKTVNGVETNYLYDGSLLLAETDASGKIQKIYINDGARIIGMVKYVYKPDGTFSHYMPMYYMFDSLDSVSAITAETGKPLQMYKYTPYGRVTNTIDDSENALRFIGAYGGYQDDDAGLTYFWHRWYDAQNGRWVSRDPIGVLGGINFYNYSGNDPVYLIDTNGLCLDLRSLIPFFTYGNYGAPGYTAGVWTLCTAPDWKVPPKDSLDRCYKNHDMCYHNACSDKCKLKNCDMALEFCLYDTLFGSSNFGYFGTAYGLTSGLFIGIKAGFGLY